jgi:hypothetical protein
MDSGAFAAESMGFSLDPYEVAEMHAVLKADLIVPLDRIILAEDPDAVIEQKVAETISNTEILLDFRPKGSEIVGPLQGHSPEIIKEMFEKYRALGIRNFALGGLVFQSDLNMTLDLIKTAREITQGFTFHVFGKFLHPRLLKPVIEIGTDSVDGFGYILSSVRGLYIDVQKQQYEVITNINDEELKKCSCQACQENTIQDFQRGDEDSQYLLIIHNIHALIKLKELYINSLNASVVSNMEALSTYLVLSGYLTPGEALLLQKILDAPLKKSKAMRFLKESSFSDYENIIAGLETKQLIKADNKVYPDWKGIKIFIKQIEEKMMKIAHDLMSMKKLTEERIHEPIESPLEDGSQKLSIETLITQFKGNKIKKSEKTLFGGTLFLEGVDLTERLADFDIVKITPKKRSRTISLTAEGAVLRYLFLNKSNLNKANYDWLETIFLAPRDASWESFLEMISSAEDEVIPSWVTFLIQVFTELRVLIPTEQGFLLAEEKSSSPFSKAKRDKLEESVSNFIPVYVSHLREVLIALKTHHRPKDLKKNLKFASSTLGGILGMLVKFDLAIKGEKKYWLTPEGEKLVNLSADDFQNAFREHIKDNLIFSEALKFVKKAPDGKIGFMDLVGYFRASGISNFNPAKALSVLRIMSETEFGIKEVEGESRSYQLIEKE